LCSTFLAIVVFVFSAGRKWGAKLQIRLYLKKR
jgi:hypothetical protein